MPAAPRDGLGNPQATPNVDAPVMSVALSRRALTRGALAGALVSLAEACGDPRRPSVAELLGGASTLGDRLARGVLTPRAWQTQMGWLFDAANPEALALALDLERLREEAPRVERGAGVIRVPASARLPASRVPPLKVFFFEAGRANPPHAHDAMVSMHLVLRGRFRVRHFERLEDTDEAIRVRPSIDRVLFPGEQTSISDTRDNVHWHLAHTRGALLDVPVTGLSSDRPTKTHLLDPAGAVRGDDDSQWLPRLSGVEEALDRYG